MNILRSKYLYIVCYYILTLATNFYFVCLFLLFSCLKISAYPYLKCEFEGDDYRRGTCFTEVTILDLPTKMRNDLIYNKITEALNIKVTFNSFLPSTDIVIKFTHLIDWAVENGFDPSYQVTMNPIMAATPGLGCKKPYKDQGLIHVMAAIGCTDCILYLVEKLNVDVNQLDCRDRSIVHYAALKGRIETLLFFINYEDFNLELLNKGTMTVLDLSRKSFIQLADGTRPSMAYSIDGMEMLLYPKGALRSKTMDNIKVCNYQFRYPMCSHDLETDERFCGDYVPVKQNDEWIMVSDEYEDPKAFPIDVHMHACGTVIETLLPVCEAYGKNCNIVESAKNTMEKEYGLKGKLLKYYLDKDVH